MNTLPAAGKLDLHGLTVGAAIERFVNDYNARVKCGQLGCWEVIHGYGSSGEGGVIRSKLRALLEQHRDKLKYEAGDQYGNPGWTWVYPKTKLPNHQEQLATSIRDFCSTPKSEEKILHEFAKENGLKVKEAIRIQMKLGLLKTLNKNGRSHYITVMTSPA